MAQKTFQNGFSCFSAAIDRVGEFNPCFQNTEFIFNEIADCSGCILGDEQLLRRNDILEGQVVGDGCQASVQQKDHRA